MPGRAKHQCFAVGCSDMLPPWFPFCQYHWYKLPKVAQRKIKAEPENRDLLVAAVKWLARKEGRLEGSTLDENSDTFQGTLTGSDH